MSIERSDTRAPGLPAGSYRFTIDGAILKKRFDSGSVYYETKVTTVLEGQLKTHTEKIAVWKAAPFLRAWGCKEIEPEIFEWDKEAVSGTEFDADITFEADKKDKSKQYRRLTNPRPAVGALPQATPATDDDMPF